jgi:hypothetical protein
VKHRAKQSLSSWYQSARLFTVQVHHRRIGELIFYAEDFFDMGTKEEVKPNFRTPPR